MQDDSSLSDFLSTALDEADFNEKPIFSIEQVQLQFDLKNGLKHLLVQSNKMYILLSTSIIKIDLENPSVISKITVPPSTEITNAWLNPSGMHLIVQTNNSQYHYLHNSYKSLKPLAKLKNLNVDQILFFDSSDTLSTNEFLLSTNDGQLLLSSIKSHNSDNKRDDTYLRSVYKFSAKQPVWGLSFDDTLSQLNVFTENLCYTWDCFDTTYAEILRVFKSSYKTTKLPSLQKSVFTTNHGTYAAIYESGKIFTNDREIFLSGRDNLPDVNIKLADFILTQHHLIGLSAESLLIFNKLSPSLRPIQISLLEYGNDFIGITIDQKSNTYWLYSNNTILEIIINNESVSVWYNYFKMGNFDEALQSLDKSNPKHAFKIDMINIAKGYDCLQRGGFGSDILGTEEDKKIMINLQMEGIRILASLTESFEKISLMLSNHYNDLPPGLNVLVEKLELEYLKIKFQIARDIEKSKIRAQILSSWIIELMLRIIHHLEKSQGEILKDKSMTNTELKKLHDSFNDFLHENYKHLHRETVYQIITDLHFPEKLTRYAELIEDYEFIVHYYIDNNQWRDALKFLLKIESSEEHSNEIIYSTSNILLTNAPKATVGTWAKFGSASSGLEATSVDVSKLLPAILFYNKNNLSIPLQENHGIHYLKLIIEKGIRSKDVNNCYLSLLVTYPNTSHNKTSTPSNFEIAEKMLHKFLAVSHSESGRGIIYNPQLTLRLSLAYKHYQIAVLILIQDFDLFEQALKLALDHNFFDLGEFVLRKYDDINKEKGLNGATIQESNIGEIFLLDKTYSKRKKLWIIFAKYLVESVCKEHSWPIQKSQNLDVDLNGISKVGNGHIPAALDLDIQSACKELISSTKSDIQHSELILVKLNQVLKYVLETSNQNSNSSFMGLKDLLPLVPKNIVINSFKDEIVNSLNQYNEKIGELSREMKESLEISSTLKQQIKDMSKPSEQGQISSIILPGEACLICKELLIKRVFVYFPNCHHGFHKDCLIRMYLKLKNYRFKKIFEDFKLKSTEFTKSELNENLEAECILCNDLNINQIELNLTDPIVDSVEMHDWSL